jgi:hypothetical protein
VYAHPEPSSANRTGYYVESTDALPLPIGKLGHFTAHIHCLRIIPFRGLDARMAEQELNLLKLSACHVTEPGTGTAAMPREKICRAGRLTPSGLLTFSSTTRHSFRSIYRCFKNSKMESSGR